MRTVIVNGITLTEEQVQEALRDLAVQKREEESPRHADLVSNREGRLGVLLAIAELEQAIVKAKNIGQGFLRVGVEWPIRYAIYAGSNPSYNPKDSSTTLVSGVQGDYTKLSPGRSITFTQQR